MAAPTSQLGAASLVKIYLAGAVTCVALSAGTYLFGVRPAVARHAELAGRQAELKTAKQKAAGLLGMKNNVQGQLNAANDALKGRALRLEPASTVNSRVLTLTLLAKNECHLEIEEMRPLATTEAADYVAVPILIAGSGTYPNCAKFLHRIRTRFPDTAVRSFETTNNSASPDSPSATFQFELVWHAAKG